MDGINSAFIFRLLMSLVSRKEEARFRPSACVFNCEICAILEEERVCKNSVVRDMSEHCIVCKVILEQKNDLEERRFEE